MLQQAYSEKRNNPTYGLESVINDLHPYSIYISASLESEEYQSCEDLGRFQIESLLRPPKTTLKDLDTGKYALSSDMFDNELIYHLLINKLHSDKQVNRFEARLIDGQRKFNASINARLKKNHKWYLSLSIHDLDKIRMEKPLEIYSAFAHDARNVIQQIYSILELMKFRNQGSNNPEINRILSYIDTLSGIIDQTHQEFKGESKQKRLNIPKLLKELIQTYKQEHQDISFEISSRETLYSLGDPVKLRRALDNIYRNAVRHAFKKQKLEKEKEEPRVRTRVYSQEDLIVIDISDNGFGIPDNFKEHIFDFEIKSEDSDGSGIGLHTTKKYIEEMNGNIYLLDSKKGAHFRIELPKL